MNVDDYQKSALRTASVHNCQYDMLRDAAYGLNGEAGEVIDILKKHEFQGHELDVAHVKEELGDVAWYLALACSALGVHMSEILQANIDKLYKRYPTGFSADRSINREV